jgi:hypothetical protein
MSQNIIVETLDEDRFARTTRITIGEKTVYTPNFGTLVQNILELDSLINLSMLSESKYLGTYVVRIFDAPKIIVPRLRHTEQISIASLKSVEELFLKFARKNVLFIDPSLEYLLYEFHAKKFVGAIKGLRTNAKQLETLLCYLEERDATKKKISEKEYEIWKKAFHKKFWYDLDRNQPARNKFVGDYLDIETLCASEVFMPPVPVVDSEGMLDIAIRINTFAKTIAPRTRPCAAFLLFQKSLLSNDALVDKVIAYLRADPTQLTIIKIKNLDLWTPGYVRQRENYRKLMDAMHEIRQRNPDKVFMALESWYVSYASACYGYNVVSSSMHGFDRDSDFGTNTYGSWFDPELMYYIPFDELKDKVLKNTHNHVMPCYCSVCKGIKNLEGVSKDEWYRLRREHYTLTMNEYMRMISQAISERTIELARDKLANSQLALLQTLIPRQ